MVQPIGSAPAGASQPTYSLAHERFVSSDDDTVGLIAYALYKSAIRQEAIAGSPSAAGPRAPVAAMVDVYRQAAEQRIATIIDGAIAQATPNIQGSAAVAAITAAKDAAVAASGSAETNLKAHIDNRTSFKQSIFTSFVGWLLTLGVTAIIIFLAGRPSVEDRIRNAVSSNAPANTSLNQSGN